MFSSLPPIHFEVWLALGYSTFLLAAALLLERMARHVHHHSGRYHHAGFRFDVKQDIWECPEGEALRRIEDDLEKKVMRYRARSDVCNGCRLKGQCTDSLNGREIHRSTENWIDSEIGRFHRGLSLALCALATLMSGAVLLRHHALPEAAVLLLVLLAVAALTRALLREIIAAKKAAEQNPWSPKSGAINGAPRSANDLIQIQTSNPFNDDGKK